MTSHDRKPLRRTAWSLFAGGLTLLAVLVVAGVVASEQGEDVGPGTTAAWPPGRTITLLRPLGPGSPAAASITCTATTPGLEPARLPIGESISPAGSATIACDRPVKLVSGPARVIAQTSRSPLVLVPIGMIIIGLFLFFPRFSLVLARMGVPFKRT